MRPFALILAASFSLAALGCNQPEWPTPDRTVQHRWLINTYHDDAIRNGVLAQHTLAPHHFQPFGAELNELGERDLDILATHYSRHPGRLNVRRGDADDALYDARVKAVRDALAGGGVDVARVQIADELPGGEGLVSEQVVVILEKKMDKPLTDDRSRSTSGASSSTIR